MSDFEAQCDCELDSPGVLSHLPVGERLKHWTDWALYLKRRIETHYRPRIAALEERIERLKVCGNCGHMVTHELWYQCGTVPDIGEAYEVPCAPPLNCHFTPSRWQRRES